MEYYEKLEGGIVSERGYINNGKKEGYWEYYKSDGSLYYVSFHVASEFYDNEWYKLGEDEYRVLSKYVFLDERYINNRYYYMVGNCKFISKLEDDYYYYYDGEYNKCDQLSELIKKIKR